MYRHTYIPICLHVQCICTYLHIIRHMLYRCDYILICVHTYNHMLYRYDYILICVHTYTAQDLPDPCGQSGFQESPSLEANLLRAKIEGAKQESCTHNCNIERASFLLCKGGWPLQVAVAKLRMCGTFSGTLRPERGPSLMRASCQHLFKLLLSAWCCKVQALQTAAATNCVYIASLPD